MASPAYTDYYVIPRTIYNASNPEITDDASKGIEVGQFWINTTTKDIFQCKDNTTGAAKWYICVFQMDPTGDTVPDYQTEINDAVSSKNVLITPEIIYNGNDTIDYDVTIPTGASAVSIGPITVETGRTVTVDGYWTII